jgi:hypothetical protein
MQTAAGIGALVQADDLDDTHRWIVADLVSLMEHLQASMKLIDSTVAGKSPFGEQEVIADVVILDDVTAGYVKLSAALDASKTRLGSVLHLLLDNGARAERDYSMATAAPLR